MVVVPMAALMVIVFPATCGPPCINAKADNRVHGAESPTTVLSKLIWIHRMPSVVDLPGIKSVNGEYSIQFLIL